MHPENVRCCSLLEGALTGRKKQVIKAGFSQPFRVGALREVSFVNRTLKGIGSSALGYVANTFEVLGAKVIIKVLEGAQHEA
ncbi:hypothetical protein SAMN05444359_11774 [Neolewinella agarilytica]|uniref:Uncharacterized protein n=1 Tax=Neolewinella agarilytica TaxID=478744 RepID=A0A1H9JHL5_9BACT|nr:hypothetical protein SAMN05444359_11774 [Neolewinella agarilytica]